MTDCTCGLQWAQRAMAINEFTSTRWQHLRYSISPLSPYFAENLVGSMHLHSVSSSSCLCCLKLAHRMQGTGALSQNGEALSCTEQHA